MSTPTVWSLATPGARERFVAEAERLCGEGKHPFAKFLEEPRTSDQNAMIYALYGEIAKQSEDQAEDEIRRHCKLHFGVPILRRDSEKFRKRYNEVILHNLNYEQKLLAMDILDVTSLMGKRQASEYIDAVIRNYSQQGFYLASPEEQEQYHG